MNAQDFFEELFRLARQRFEEYEVYAVKGESFFAKVTAQKCEKYTVQNTAGVSFRAKKNGRIGYASSTVFSEESAAALVENAAKTLRFWKARTNSLSLKAPRIIRLPTATAKSLRAPRRSSALR